MSEWWHSSPSSQTSRDLNGYAPCHSGRGAGNTPTPPATTYTLEPPWRPGTTSAGRPHFAKCILPWYSPEASVDVQSCHQYRLLGMRIVRQTPHTQQGPRGRTPEDPVGHRPLARSPLTLATPLQSPPVQRAPRASDSQVRPELGPRWRAPGIPIDVQ